MAISPLAFVHPDAKIGQNVSIGHFAVVEAKVVLGDGCEVASHAIIQEYSIIGQNCKIFAGAVIGGIPQDLKFEGEESYVDIGNNTTIREYVTINRGTKAAGITKIGNHCFIMAYTHVAHDCQIGDHCIIVNNVQIAGHVEIHDWAVVGGSSSVHQFVKIGAHAMIAGGSLVRKDVPPYVTAAREPLAFTGINILGLKRRDFSDEKINEIHAIYRILFQSKLNLSEAILALEVNQISHENQTIFDFLKASTRGIIKGK